MLLRLFQRFVDNDNLQSLSILGVNHQRNALQLQDRFAHNVTIRKQFYGRSYKTTPFLAIVRSIVGWVLRHSKLDL